MPYTPIAAQLMTVYLAASETFIYRHLAHLQRWQPHIFAERLERLDQFPLPQISSMPRPALWRRAPYGVLRRLIRDETLRPVFRTDSDLSDAQLIHAHFGEAGIASLPLQRRVGLPLVTSFYGRDIAKPSSRPYGRLLYRRLFKIGAACVALSEFMRAQLIALGAPAERVALIRLGLDVQAVRFAPRTWPVDGHVRVLTCGRLVEKKGTRYTLAACARVMPQYPHLQLTVIGDGPLRPALEQQAEQLGIARQVRFLGVQPVQRVFEELARSHLFMLPCVTAADGDQEGTPAVLMEAQAVGLPVLSSWHTGVPEVVRDGVAGYLVPERDVDALAQQLLHLLERPEQWPELGLAGRRHIEAHFDVAQAAEQLQMLYDRVAYAPPNIL